MTIHAPTIHAPTTADAPTTDAPAADAPTAEKVLVPIHMITALCNDTFVPLMHAYLEMPTELLRVHGVPPEAMKWIYHVVALVVARRVVDHFTTQAEEQFPRPELFDEITGLANEMWTTMTADGGVEVSSIDECAAAFKVMHGMAKGD